jgi:uncharacterized protein (TIGR00730 family)
MKCCIFGAASPLIDQKYVKKTEDLGRFLAKNGHSLVFGAGANGLMGAAARGFFEEKGEIVGVIPRFFRDENIEEIFEDCTEIVYTETMQERKFTMEELADCFIIVPGGIGTFEEFFEVLTLKQLGRHNKPIIIYNIDNYYEHLEEMMAQSMAHQFINENCHALYEITEDPDRLLAYLEQPDQPQLSVHQLKDG